MGVKKSTTSCWSRRVPTSWLFVRSLGRFYLKLGPVISNEMQRLIHHNKVLLQFRARDHQLTFEQTWMISNTKKRSGATSSLISISCCSTVVSQPAACPTDTASASVIGNARCSSRLCIQIDRTWHCARIRRVWCCWNAPPTFPCSRLPFWRAAQQGKCELDILFF